MKNKLNFNIMKNTLIIIVILFCSFGVRAQERSVALSGGYVFANIDETDVNADGFRLNGLFDFNPQGGKFSHGFSVGYAHMTASGTKANLTADYKINSFPIYYAPRISFGSESFKIFLKGALGVHFSHYNRTSEHVEINDWDAGLYAGAGLGFVKSINEKVSLSLEYEWAYMNNTAYVSGFLNSAMLGIGIRL
jgi:hypothetical protein